MSANVTIGTYVPPVKANPYDGVIAALVEAGEDAAATIEIVKSDLGKTARQFGDAANAQGYTAKRRQTLAADGTELDKEGIDAIPDSETVSLVYTLGPKQNRPGRPRKDAAVETVTVAPAPPTPTPAGPPKNGKK